MLPDEGDFAVARLRLLSPRQYALSLLVATGRADFAAPDALQSRVERLAGASGVERVKQYLSAEEKAAPLSSQLDRDSQSSADEALYLSNNTAIQTLVAAEPNTLAAKLAELSDNTQIADAAIRQVYCRPPAAGEVDRLAEWLVARSHASSKSACCEQLIWVLATSAEFRFQH
jgi:hypothetical protein